MDLSVRELIEILEWVPDDWSVRVRIDGCESAGKYWSFTEFAGLERIILNFESEKSPEDARDY